MTNQIKVITLQEFTGTLQIDDAGDKKEDSSFEVFACYETGVVNKTNIIIDTGATKTVVGETTLKKITMNWDNDSKQKLIIDKSKGGECALLKFGDERTVKKQRIIHTLSVRTYRTYRFKNNQIKDVCVARISTISIGNGSSTCYESNHRSQ